MQEPALAGERIVSDLMERVKGTARVEAVYGESRQVGEKTIIPVALVTYAFGAGAGGGRAPGHNGEGPASGGGGGGGGAVRVHPVGVLEISAGETRLVPVLDWSRIAIRAVTLLGLWMVARALTRKRR